ncbi:helix-turn-helix domain-containing protein [Gordonia soli]|uniref:Putative AraC family transcriptional regulator n=1 Tax=Gordonia soli NBRC 108243 TaxID=1223545 RepID=M0QQR5_9ACTN|nr:helix-turn-helix domain-containing protein [Gordonia soli]GAC70903.1 putative AraC family transcriptional regulator [Gordonia soli NBRC 108243]
MHRVAILAYEGMTGFEAGIAAEIFGMTELSDRFSAGVPRPWYEVQMCAEQPSVPVVGGATLTVAHGLESIASADTVIVPSVHDVTARPSEAVVESIRSAAIRGARLVSICSGAFVLAAAGVLDGRRATTHWIYADDLVDRFPDVEVDRSALYVDEGQILTSAGCAAGLDLCVHLIRRDHGPQVANDVARRLVIAPHRSGGQAQYVETPSGPADDEGTIGTSMAWALANIDRPLTLDEMADHVHLSRRSYLRRFTAHTGTTPIKWLIAQRIGASLALLEDGSESIEEVGRQVGFPSVITYRHHFTRIMRTTPREYRASFRTD